MILKKKILGYKKDTMVIVYRFLEVDVIATMTALPHTVYSSYMTGLAIASMCNLREAELQITHARETMCLCTEDYFLLMT